MQEKRSKLFAKRPTKPAKPRDAILVQPARLPPGSAAREAGPAVGFRSAVEKKGPQTFGLFSRSKTTNEMNYLAQKFARTVRREPGRTRLVG